MCLSRKCVFPPRAMGTCPAADFGRADKRLRCWLALTAMHRKHRGHSMQIVSLVGSVNSMRMGVFGVGFGGGDRPCIAASWRSAEKQPRRQIWP